MDTKKLAVVLLIVAILFSVGTIWVSVNSISSDLVPASTNTVRTIESDNGNVGVGVLDQPTGGSG